MRYTGTNVRIVHDLHYSWTGWPSSGALPAIDPAVFADLRAPWASDGLVLESHVSSAESVHATFAAGPSLPPVFVTQRAKGRLQHALRTHGAPADFSRKTGLRAIGHNLNATVAAYLRGQLNHVELADPKYVLHLAEASEEVRDVDLSQPAETNSGRYWYNLHVVLVTANRMHMGSGLAREVSERVRVSVRESGCVLKSLALMPDHIHVAMRGNPASSPAELALAIQNASAAAAGCMLWQEEFYVGTFGVYTMAAVR